MRRVAVTGLGAVTPVGNDVETTWQSLIAGKSGIGPITTFDAETYKVKIAGLVKDFDLAEHVPDAAMRENLSRAGEFGVAAAVQALADADVANAPYAPEERGLAIGASVGRPELQDLAEMLHRINEGAELYRQPPAISLRRDPNLALSAIAQLGECQGPMIGVSTACTASGHAFGEAYRRIQEGDAKLMIAGGFDALTSWLDVLGFSLLGALTVEYNDDPTRASRPFDAKRSGFVLGEGGVLAVLEDFDSARERGARIYCEIVGYGSSLNAYRITDAPPDGGGTIFAIARALEESGLKTDEIDYVAAHGTGTAGNDLSETNALKHVFGDDAYRLSVSSAKSMTGHMTCAAAALSLVIASCAMRDSIVPPTINLDNPDPKLDLDYVPNVAREREVRAAMFNAFAFGGTNASVVVRRPDLAESA
jgi:3-oxoacyl-[acyl-carrier-protein] synthase II